jgi:hypothetical protein
MNEVFVHFLNGGPADGDQIPNHRPWDTLVVTKYCDPAKHEAHPEPCQNCKKHKYIKIEQETFQEADCPGLEVITQDGVDQAPILHRVNMEYEGPA